MERTLYRNKINKYVVVMEVE